MVQPSRHETKSNRGARASLVGSQRWRAAAFGLVVTILVINTLIAVARAHRDEGTDNHTSSDARPFDGVQLEQYRGYLAEQNFAAAVARVEQVETSPAVRAQLRGQAYRAWARHLAVADVQIDGAEQNSAQARDYFCRAGRAFDQTALAHRTADCYADDLWNAAESYFAGKDFPCAGTALRAYLAAEPAERRATAIVNLAECDLALDRVPQAIEALRSCIASHGADAAVFRARLLLSTALCRENQWLAAAEILQENLTDAALEPTAHEWRSAAFARGWVLYRAGRYDAAVAACEFALARFPNDDRCRTTRFFAADARRRQAIGAFDPVTAITHYEACLAHFRALLGDDDQAAIGAPIEATLRSCARWGTVGALVALDRIEAAAVSLQALLAEGLIEQAVPAARGQLAACLAQCGRPEASSIVAAQRAHSSLLGGERVPLSPAAGKEWAVLSSLEVGR